MGTGNKNPISPVGKLFEGVEIESNVPVPKEQDAAADLSAARSPGQEDDTAPPLPLRHYYLQL